MHSDETGHCWGGQAASAPPQSRHVAATGTTMKQCGQVVSRITAGGGVAGAAAARLRAGRSERAGRDSTGARTVGVPPSAGIVAPKKR